MKRLLIALVAAVAVSTVFARNTKQGFETDMSGFDKAAGDESARVEYNGATTPSPLAGLFDSAGSYFLDIDTGDATLWCTNSGDATYFDMNMQFNVSTTEPEIAEGTKLAVYLNASSNLVVMASGEPAAVTNLNPGTWARLTIVGGENKFKLYLDGNSLGEFTSRGSDASITAVGFNGSGALDNFVARTTDPFLQNPAATIDGEGYASYKEALEDALAAETPATITLADGTTTMDGTAAKPYQIQDADSLIALQNAVLANAAVRSLNYVQTANINMTGVADFYGIGWFDSSTSFASVPTGVASNGKTAIPFAGTYDGQGYTISNVTIVKHSYAGVFNNVSGTVRNLTVQDIGLSGTCSEWGCAIVGNAGPGSLLENLTAETSSGFNWGSSANHNVAGIVVRPYGAATIRGCVNNANISSVSKRLGGIASFVGSKAEGTVFDSCTNNAALVSTDGTRGVGGILGCAEGGLESGPTAAATIIRNCVDFGSETAQASGGHAGAIVGSNWNESYTYTDDGGNIFKASTVDCGYAKNAVFGRAYAVAETIDGVGYLKTVKSSDLAKGNTYELLTNIPASETPVITLADKDEAISFKTNNFTFAGTIAVNHDGVEAVSATENGVITYTATVTDAWAYRLGNVVDGAYVIDDVTELAAFAEGINVAKLSTASKTFKLGADIDATGLGYFDGVGTASGTNGSSGLNNCTFDGAGYTISNVKFSNAKYRGFFNQVLNSTIKDLTINVVDIAQHSNPSAEHGYAAFAGNAKGSAFINCVATGTIGTTAKPSMHTTAGIVVKVDSACSFTACTNKANIVCSLTDNPKVGGIAGLFQGGALTNCWNNGDITITCKKCNDNGNGAGGLIGYAQTSACTIVGGGNAGTIQSTNTTADGGSHEVHVGSIIGMANAAMTVSGGTVAQDTIAAFGTGVANANGLKFATVDNGVATFVADNALALNGSYKVMGANVTATFAFAEAGTIAFDTALATPTWAVTAADGLTLTDATEGTVKTYTAVVTPTYTITFISGEGSTTNEYSIRQGNAVVPPTAAEVTGKTFDSWSPAVVTPAAADATYTAVYTNNIYTITYYDGESVLDLAPAAYTFGTGVAELPAAGTKTGYTFAGWYAEAGFENKVESIAANVTGNISLYAKYTVDTPQADPTTGKAEADTAEKAAEAVMPVSSDVVTALETAKVSAETYQTYFTKSEPVLNESTGKYEVEFAIDTAIEQAVETAALDVLSDKEDAAVTVPAGLYYKVETVTEVGATDENPKTGLSDGTALELTKPKGNKGFFKINIGTKSYED